MKLRNKKTGEIDDYIFEVITDRIDLYRRVGHSDTKNIWHYNSIAELNEEWEDYEGPTGCWIINIFGVVEYTHFRNEVEAELLKEIGNYFETREEAEKVAEKRKAWKRLENKGFRFTGWATNEGIRGVDFEVPDSFFSEHNHSCISDGTRDDLDLLFSQEDN